MIGLIADCEASSFQCGLTIITSTYSFVVIIFAAMCVIRMLRSKYNLRSEALPLITTLLQSSLQFIQNTLIQDIRVLISSQYVQSITFSFIALSFILLWLRTNNSTEDLIHSKRKQRHVMYGFVVFKISIIALCIAMITTISKGDCGNWFGTNYYIPLSLSGLSMLVTVIFGIGLYKNIRKEHSIALIQTESDNEIVVLKNIKQYHQLQSQIKYILITYAITTLAQVALNIVREFIIYESMTCSNDYIFSAEKTGAEIFLFFFTIIEVTPCLIVPYAFYYVPFARANKQKKNDDFVFKFYNNSYIDSTQDDMNSSQISSTSSISKNGVAADDIEEEVYQNNNVKYGAIISSNYISSTRESEDTNYRSTFNTIKQKQFSNNSNNNNNNNNTTQSNHTSITPLNQSDNNISMLGSNNLQKVLSNHKSQPENDDAYFEEYVRVKRSTVAGIAAMDFGFKKSDFEKRNNDDSDDD